MSTSEKTPSEMSTLVKPVQWRLVFFKVEGLVFPVPQNRFTEHSEVFADMFHFPPGDVERVEGDNDNPITLEGYKALDFNALLKVLYPSPDDLILGRVCLSKEEWIGVLNLSTRWQMRRIRQLAVVSLSTFSLDSVEKVVLSRSYKVAKWLREGLLELVFESPLRASEELRSHLGLETAFRLLCLRDQGWAQNTGLALTLGSLGCPICQGPAFTEDKDCHSCRRRISLKNQKAIYLSETTKPVPSRLSKRDDEDYKLLLNARSLKCKACQQPFETATYTNCSSCSISSAFDSYVFMGLKAPKVVESQVYEVFAEEIAEYVLVD